MVRFVYPGTNSSKIFTPLPFLYVLSMTTTEASNDLRSCPGGENPLLRYE